MILNLDGKIIPPRYEGVEARRAMALGRGHAIFPAMITPAKRPPKPKLNDAERHARFVETARQVEVDESPGAFDRAFDKLNTKTSPKKI